MLDIGGRAEDWKKKRNRTADIRDTVASLRSCLLRLTERINIGIKGVYWGGLWI